MGVKEQISNKYQKFDMGDLPRYEDIAMGDPVENADTYYKEKAPRGGQGQLPTGLPKFGFPNSHSLFHM